MYGNSLVTRFRESGGSGNGAGCDDATITAMLGREVASKVHRGYPFLGLCFFGGGDIHFLHRDPPILLWRVGFWASIVTTNLLYGCEAKDNSWG